MMAILEYDRAIVVLKQTLLPFSELSLSKRKLAKCVKFSGKKLINENSKH